MLSCAILLNEFLFQLDENADKRYKYINISRNLMEALLSHVV